MKLGDNRSCYGKNMLARLDFNFFQAAMKLQKTGHFFHIKQAGLRRKKRENATRFLKAKK